MTSGARATQHHVMFGTLGVSADGAVEQAIEERWMLGNVLTANAADRGVVEEFGAPGGEFALGEPGESWFFTFLSERVERRHRGSPAGGAAELVEGLPDAGVPVGFEHAAQHEGMPGVAESDGAVRSRDLEAVELGGDGAQRAVGIERGADGVEGVGVVGIAFYAVLGAAVAIDNACGDAAVAVFEPGGHGD